MCELEYKELSESAQKTARNKAVENFGYDLQWELEEEVFQFCTEEWGGTHVSLPDIGLQTDPKNVSYIFGDRGEYFTPKDVEIIDRKKFIKFLGLDGRTWEARELGYAIMLNLGSTHYTRHPSFTVSWELDYYAYDLPKEKEIDYEKRAIALAELVKERLDDLFQDFVIICRKICFNIYTDEYFENYLEANEPKYYPNGTRV